MPVISFFYGIIVQMLWDGSSHNLPHIHVEYQHCSAAVDLQGNYIKGELPPNKKKLLDAWIELHQEELHTCWALMQKGEPHIKIEPLRYSPRTSKSEQDGLEERHSMSRPTCPARGANALDCAENGASRRKAGSGMGGVGEARQSVPMVKGVHYNSKSWGRFSRWSALESPFRPLADHRTKEVCDAELCTRGNQMVAISRHTALDYLGSLSKGRLGGKRCSLFFACRLQRPAGQKHLAVV